MPTIDITGTITTPGGVGVSGVVVQLAPAPSDPGASQAQGGVGIITTPDLVQTDVNGVFTIPATVGFRYTLTIDAIGFERTFIAPAVNTRFDLLGLTPQIESIADWSSDGCEGVIIDDPVAAVDYVKLIIKVEDITTVKERFDTIALEVAPAQTGPWADTVPGTIDLIDGQTFYEITFSAAPNTEWYRVQYEHSTNADVSAFSDVVPADSDDEQLIISVDELKETYLFGVDLTDDEGTPYPDRMFRSYIKSAVAWLEKQLDIPITPTEIVDETHDHMASDYGRWGWFQMDKYPVICMREANFQYPSMTAEVVMDPRWLVLQEKGESGQLQIVPGQGSIADVLLIPGQLMPMWSGAMGRVPGVWHFDYRAGFEVGEVPADIVDIIGMKAAIQIFAIAGDLIAGAGIANTSISVPGLSQSVGTTSSATNSGYGARIIQYEKQIKDAVPGLRRYYGKNTKMVVA